MDKTMAHGQHVLFDGPCTHRLLQYIESNACIDIAYIVYLVYSPNLYLTISPYNGYWALNPLMGFTL